MTHLNFQNEVLEEANCKTDILLFLRLVANRKFPISNIAFQLFLVESSFVFSQSRFQFSCFLLFDPEGYFDGSYMPPHVNNENVLFQKILYSAIVELLLFKDIYPG